MHTIHNGNMAPLRSCISLQISFVIIQAFFATSFAFTMNWKPLGPSNFEQTVSEDGRQFAKDEAYSHAVLHQWESEPSSIPVETSPFVYYCEDRDDGQQYPLFGHVVCRTRNNTTSSRSQSSPLPGILLFHTGAGPQDVFLFYKSAVLLQSFDCVVFICDILSDERGWAWGPDRTHYNFVRASLIKDNASLLKSRVSAAAKALCDFTESGINVDPQSVAAMGWCLGGQPVMELAQLGPSLTSSISGFCVRAMVTFHGVFRRDIDGGVGNIDKEEGENNGLPNEVLICNGVDDPFVSKQDVQDAKKLFSDQGFNVNILEMEGAKHGFSNPAQSMSDNTSFDYSESAATTSWDVTMKLLERTLFLNRD
jgi:dienelactone hydrolase